MAIAHSIGTTVTIGSAVVKVESVTTSTKLEVAEVRALDGTKVQRVVGLIDDGTIEITGYADGANFDALRDTLTAKSAVSCTVTGSDTSEVTFNGYVTEVRLISDAGDAIKFSATVVARGAS